MIARQQRWRVRRFVTIGIFAFARLVMYSDLDPRQWSTSLSKHPIVSRLLAGSDDPVDDALPIYDVDSPEIEAAVPYAIADADSSQHSAVVDVVRGRNLVIVGPPGTGKSQTITNVIAACMHAGKSVLFVAEKMAALNVVKSRLDDAGLGGFCLEVHSAKARRKDVIASLADRIALQADGRPHEIAEKREELKRLKHRLNVYAQVLNTRFGAVTWTLHDILWREQDARRRLGAVPEWLGTVQLAKVRDVSDGLLNDALEACRVLASAYERVREYADPAQPPWAFVVNPLSPAEQQLLRAAVTGWYEALFQLCSWLHEQREWLGAARVSRGAATTLAEALCALPPVGTADATVLSRLSDTTIEQALSRYLDALSDRDRWLATLDQWTSAPQAVCAAVGRLRELMGRVDVPAGVSGDLTISSLAPTVASITADLADLERIERVLDRVAARIGAIDAAPALRNWMGVTKIVDVLASTPRAVLLSRSGPLLDESSGRVLDAMKAAAAQVLADEARLRERMVGTFEGASPDVLRAHADALVGAGIFSFLSGRVRAARRFHATMMRPAASTEAMAADLMNVATHIETRWRFAADVRAQQLLGSLWNGLATDFELALEVNRWGATVRAALRGTDPFLAKLRSVVLEGSVDDLDDLASLANDPDFLQARSSKALEGIDSALSSSAHIAKLRARRDCVSWSQELTGQLALRTDPPVRALKTLVDVVVNLERVESSLRDNRAAQEILRLGIAGGRESLRATTTLAETLRTAQLTDSLRTKLFSDYDRTATSARAIGARLLALVAAVDLQEQAFRRTGYTVEAILGGSATHVIVDEAMLRVKRLVDQVPSLADWVEYRRARLAAKRTLFEPLVGALEGRRKHLDDLPVLAELVFHRSLCDAAFAEYPHLREATGTSQEEARRRFAALDREILKLNQRALAASLCAREYDKGKRSPRKREWTGGALIEHEASKKARHVPLRDLFERAGLAAQQLKPCFMMSPMSVAQFLKPGALTFDVLIIDEASQMQPEDALGAIGRARQIVVVGDPKQLPPTNFFQRAGFADDEEPDEEEDERIQSESILDLTRAAYHPVRDLRWHYRSRHESLIAFSNTHFYDNRLRVFPSPADAGERLGVVLRRVEGHYKSSINEREAFEVAEAVADFMQRHPDRSLGVVAMNRAQADLIRDEVERRIKEREGLATYEERWKDTLAPFIIKNLENVQGDERDVIFVSMTYGPDPRANKVYQRWGPISGVHGHRRLNVLFTRARDQLVLFTSLSSDDVKVHESSPQGVRALKDYLAYAESKHLLQHAAAEQPSSPFEEMVHAALCELGHEVVCQVGVEGFFIDLAIRDAARRGFVCGIECDGATYHSHKAARDRDRLRQEILEKLGWTILRVWSTDWFRDPSGALRRLNEEIERLRPTQRV